MKVVLINPDSGGRSPLMSPIPPYAAAALAAIARRRGHRVEVWDQFATRQGDQTLIDRLLAAGADMVGVSCLTPAYPTVRRILEGFRARGGKALTVLGGVHPTVFHREIAAEDWCDLIVRREGEETFDRLLSAIENGLPWEAVDGLTFRHAETVVTTPDRAGIADLDALPIPAWDTLTDGLDHYRAAPTLALYGLTLPLLGARGCPMRCTFCGQEIFHHGVRRRSVANIIAEIQELRRSVGMNNFVFLDANFPTGHAFGLAFCEALHQAGLVGEMNWSAEVAVSLIDRELIERLAEAGCRNIELGIEVGDPDILAQTRKGTTIAQARDAVRWCKDAGIHTFGLFMIGLPGEGPRHWRRTFRLARELDCDIVKFNIAVPYPGSQLFEQHRAELLRNFDPETYNSWFHSTDPHRRLTVVPGGPSAAQLLRWQRLLMLAYYARPRLVWRHLRNKTLRPSDLLKGVAFLVAGLARAQLRRGRTATGKQPA